MTLILRTYFVGFAAQNEFALRYKDNEIAIAGAGWADWDRRGRLVFVRAGKVFAAEVDDPGAVEERELADFNSARPHHIQSPHWARRW